MHQGDLFPEGAELWGLALVDLERLDLVRARTHLARAEALPRGRREADEIGGAVDWLEGCGLGPAAELDRAVEAFRETPEAVRVGLIGAGAARRADESIARFLLSRTPVHAPFVGAERPLPTGRLYLILERTEEALQALKAARADGGETSAELWSAFGDLWHRDGDEGSREAYARALALDPCAVEPYRLRDQGLAALLIELEQRHGFDIAREQLLVEAWLCDLVRLPLGGLDPGGLRVLGQDLGGTAGGDRAREEARLFTRLFLADRSHFGGEPDLDLREQMADLDPELFARVLAEFRARERRSPRLALARR